MADLAGPVAQIGTGVIGAGWTALLLAQGIEVRVVDPAPDARSLLLQYLDRAAPSLERLGHSLAGWTDRLTFCSSVAEAVDGAGFVQENGPERIDLKQTLLREIDQLTDPAVVIASSSSGLAPSELAANCTAHPERVIVGHPFNPVYLIPLVEVVGAPPAANVAMAFYTAVGKKPILVRQELPGHIANRLQAALWREAYSLVERGVAEVADIDTAIAHGPGLRWALLGPLATQHLSGGAGGLAHVLKHLGPPAQRWMDDLGAPQLTPELADLLVSGVGDELAGLSTEQLVADRDTLLVELLAAKALHPDLP
ncbi:3-hydroxyacyl-CoA dehydrogenase NAD-binding domain-containing protein [Kribbella sp. NPDC056861]|uniref:3-hydroxyacyl-CoA dehydrogenase NAD-binding domain-containing protein n=1 Tax=Kribbella sp. NPDC056861 TaxID=3154857 RepID=UPI00341C612D